MKRGVDMRRNESLIKNKKQKFMNKIKTSKTSMKGGKKEIVEKRLKAKMKMRSQPTKSKLIIKPKKYKGGGGKGGR